MVDVILCIYIGDVIFSKVDPLYFPVLWIELPGCL